MALACHRGRTLHRQATVHVYPLLDCADEGSFAAVHESGFGTTDMVGRPDDVCCRGQNGPADLAGPVPFLTRLGHSSLVRY
jgi:hypothetical protein